MNSTTNKTRFSVFSPFIMALLIILSPLALYTPVRASQALENELEIVVSSLEEMAQYIDMVGGNDIGDELIEVLLEEGWYFDPNTGLFLSEDPDETTEMFLRGMGYLNTGRYVSYIYDLTNKCISNVDEHLQIEGDEFAKVIERLNKQYAPEASSGRFSWKENYRCTTNGVAFGRFYSEGEFLNGKSLDLYMVPFYDDGEHVYFPLSQYHFSQKTTFSDSGGLSSLMIYYKLITSTDHTAITEDVAFLNSLAYRYADLGLGVYCNGSSAFGPFMAHYDSYSNYVNIKPLSAGNMASISYADYYSDYMRYFYYDLNETPIDHYTEMVYYNADPSTVNTDIDFGFYYSDKPITMKFSNIVPSNIDSDSVVTLDGENIYDYTITGAEGSTVTLGDYIQNNYTYITNNYGGSSGDGSASLPSVPDVELDLDEYLNGVDDYVSAAEGFFQSVYKIIPAPMMNVLIASFGLIVVVGVIKIVFMLK